MKISIDNQVVQLLVNDQEGFLKNSLKEQKEGILSFSWPSLLAYLGCGDVLTRFSSFDRESPLFTATVSALCEVNNQDDLFYVYDSLFTEMLKQVKSWPEIDAAFLLKKIEEKKKALPFFDMGETLFLTLTSHEKALRDDTHRAMHDLVLYLAWDRMCVCMSRLFDYQTDHPMFLRNLKGLKWCLAESYQHILSQGRSRPSFFRLVEALFYYQMREEHLQHHTESEWALLSQSFPVLKKPDELVDFFYIDHAIVPDVDQQSGAICHFTLDLPEVVQSRLELARYMMSHLEKEMPQWKCALTSSRIVHLR
jgi:hypothetical protein